jgi:hypothetical protein
MLVAVVEKSIELHVLCALKVMKGDNLTLANVS